MSKHKISKKEELFIENFLLKNNAAAAARAAGYSAAAAREIGYRLKHKHIDEINRRHNEMIDDIKYSRHHALEQLRLIALAPAVMDVSHRDRISAIKLFLEQTQPRDINVNINDNRQQIDEILQMSDADLAAALAMYDIAGDSDDN